MEAAVREWAASLMNDRAGPQVIAAGWATVDLDRATADLGGRWAAAPDDRLLGAVVRRSVERAPAILLLEPNTEGRLAAALARRGEGFAALYLGATEEHDPAAPPARTRAGDGPFGPERLIIDGPPAGPFVIVVGAAPNQPDRVPSEP